MVREPDQPQAHSEHIEPDLLAHLNEVYSQRFDSVEAESKDALWKEITRYLQRFVPPSGATLDIACDRGEFIRNIQSADKWATDIRDVGDGLPRDVHFVQGDGLLLDRVLPTGHFDVVFMSNYLEHLQTGYSVIDQFRVARALLKPGGRVIVLQPNIRLIGSRYWNFIDHRTALTEASLAEAAELAGLQTEYSVVYPVGEGGAARCDDEESPESQPDGKEPPISADIVAVTRDGGIWACQTMLR